MNNSIKEIESCRACGSGSLTTVLDLGRSPFANAYLTPDQLGDIETEAPLQVVLCETCSCVQLKHTIEPKVLFKNYHYVTGQSGSKKHFEDYAKETVSDFKLDLSKAFIVGIGGNDGTLEKAYWDMGFSVLNVEPAEIGRINEAFWWCDWFGAETARMIKSRYRQADLITCNNCFAHMPDVKDVIAGVKLLLKPEGWLVIESVDLEATLEKRLFDQFYHEHVFYWHKSALTMLLESKDMTLEKWETNSMQGGSFRATFRNRKPIGWRARVKVEKLKTGFADLKRFIDDWSKDTRAMLERLPPSATIACYGWPAKATLLARLLQLGNSEYYNEGNIKYAVDDIPAKQGLLTPGSHIPIVDREHFIREPPDYCLITATNYAKEIRAKNPQFKGEWIELMPNYG